MESAERYIKQIGKGKYVLAEYEKIKRITLPFGENLLLYLTTEVEADHTKILEKIHRLEAGLEYSKLDLSNILFY